MLRDNFCLDTESTVAGILDECSLSDSAGNKVSISLSSGRELSVSLLAAPLHATIAVSEEGRIRIVWPAGKDEVFNVEYKQSVSTPSWSLLQAGIMAVDGEASVEDTVEDFSERIYRIVRQ